MDLTPLIISEVELSGTVAIVTKDSISDMGRGLGKYYLAPAT